MRYRTLCFFGTGVKIQSSTIIKSYSYIEGTHIGKNCQIGPFARLRPGTNLSEEVKVGNFVEVKNATLASKTKANHLTYIGDAKIGAKHKYWCWNYILQL